MSELSRFAKTKVIKSHVKLHVKSDAQKVNYPIIMRKVNK